jgi:hypothetical protein
MVDGAILAARRGEAGRHSTSMRRPWVVGLRVLGHDDPVAGLRTPLWRELGIKYPIFQSASESRPGRIVRRRRYAAGGVPGGYPNLGQQKGAPVVGRPLQALPDDLLDDLNGDANYERITAVHKRYRAQKR